MAEDRRQKSMIAIIRSHNSSNKTPELAGPEVQLSRPGYRPSSERV